MCQAQVSQEWRDSHMRLFLSLLVLSSPHNGGTCAPRSSLLNSSLNIIRKKKERKSCELVPHFPFCDGAFSHSFTLHLVVELLKSLWMGPTPPRGNIVWPHQSLRDPPPLTLHFFFCPYLPAPWLQRRGKKMWNRARLIVVSVLYPHFVLLEVRNLCCGWISLLDLAPNPSNPILQFKRWSERWRSAIAECPSYFQSLFGDYLWKKSICCISITFGCF